MIYHGLDGQEATLNKNFLLLELIISQHLKITLKVKKEKVILNKNNQHFDAVNKVLAPKA